MIDYAPNEISLLFLHVLALIAAACVFTPIFKKLGLGAILGYLTAGIVVNVLFSGNFSAHPEEFLHFSEFGVTLFLFVIGLELKPNTLWSMRGDIFGLGFAQMALCGALLSVLAMLFGMPGSTAVIVGMGLALSSTAIVMSQLEERHERATTSGRKTFAILLFQDLAIVPLLLLVTLLAPTGSALGIKESAIQVGVAIACITALVLIGRFLLSGMFTLLAKARLPEIMTAGALGVVIAAAMLMDVAGMSYAMGAFIAGVMLAESTYRHEIEANIEPFRGLFLGLFFMAVGLSLNMHVIFDQWLLILLVAPAAMGVKAVALYVVARVFKNDHNTSVKVSMGLSQHGEFGFVMFSAAAAVGLLNQDLASTLTAIVSVSMALAAITGKLEPIFLSKGPETELEEDYSDIENSILIIGFGRFGQVVSQLLFANGSDITILDHDAGRIRDARRFGFRVHFGDGARRDILRAAGVNKVHTVVVCTDNPEVTTEIVALVKRENPQALTFVRSFDRVHSIGLHHLDVTDAVRETFESALLLGKRTIMSLGTDEDKALEIVDDIRRRDLERLRHQIRDGLLAGNDQLHIKPVVPQRIDLD